MTAGAGETAFIIFAITNLGALLGSHVRQSTKLDAMREDVNVIRKRLGLMNGDAPTFIPRAECEMREANVKERMDRLEVMLQDKTAER